MNRYLSKFFKNRYRPLAMLPLMLLMATAAMAQQAATTPAQSSGSMSAGAIMAVVTVAILALVIAVLAHAVIGARGVYEERMRQEKEAAGSGAAKVLALLLGTTLMGLAATAQTPVGTTEVVAAASDAIGGMPPTMFHITMATIVVELAVIIVLVNMLKFLTGIQSRQTVKAAAAGPSALTLWWDKLNKSVSIEKEKDIDLSHDYDGIRELDNSVPPWWTWAFVGVFIFSVVYLWRYHVSETAPLQVQELQIAMQRAEAEKDAYLKTSAKKVDENTVKMLDAAGIAAGKTLFERNCITCHGKNAEGNQVGPNLTDEYWLHKGDLGSIFKSIKYGWVEKGMQSWQGVFSASEIEQLASYIKSVSGTNYPGGKEPQGEPYKEETVVADSATKAPVKVDSVAPQK
jgi:cytochrome c oxidase cbb3-type subunit III